MATEKVIPIKGNENRHVHAEDDGQVDNETVHVEQERRTSGYLVFVRGKAIIAFSSQDGSPFAEATFHVPAGGSVSQWVRPRRRRRRRSPTSTL